MDIYISGSLAYDRIMRFPGKFEDHILADKLHILNVCFLVESLDEKFGGTAGNIAYSLALLGEKPTILATVGRDFERYQNRLAKLNLPMHGIRRVEGELTAGAYITTDAKDNQITGFNPGAMKHQAGTEAVNNSPEECLGIISPGNVDDMVEFARLYKALNVPYIFDPGQQIPAMSVDGLRKTLAGSAMLVSNDYELEMIARTLGKSNGELLELTGCIITTLGGEGSIIRTREGEEKVAAAKVSDVCDPTGAGDAYRAGLLKGLALGKGLRECACMGATCAAYCVERHGTQEHTFTMEDYTARLLENYGCSCEGGEPGAIAFQAVRA